MAMMGGCRCSFKNCANTTKTTENIHFFHYPVKQKERCKMWIKKAEKPQFFDLDEYQLRNKVVCEVHFEDNCFLNSQKKRLLGNAIPTLEGGSCYENKAALPPLVQKPRQRVGYTQFSTRMDDIQILPANDDGTIFVLDTFPSYKVSKQVESYILNEDSLLPAVGENRPMAPFIKTERVDEHSDVEPEFILSDDGAMNPFQQKATVKTVQPQIVNFNPNIVKKPVTNLVSQTSSPINPVDVRKNISNEDLENMICKTVESKYLHKLEQHSKDLNQIKKALRMTKVANKLNKNSVLRFLKLRLPSSLYSLVSLSILDDYTLTDEDETFFKNLHDSSPKAYQFLMDECDWRMPIIEIHEEDPNSMEEV